jgi:hypothetical protein
MNNCEYEYFNNLGIVKTKLTDSELQPIKDEINEIQNNFFGSVKYNNKLAGNIEHQYQLVKTCKYIEQLIWPYTQVYEQQFDYLKKINIINQNLPLGLDNLVWVNFMKKYEFNPAHYHSGVFSFVLWIDIPYSIEDEIKQNNCINSNRRVPGHFEFLYTDSLGKITSFSIPVDKTYNNTLIVFPSSLMHLVYPFATSDEYRISVSGNYKLIVQ